MLTIASVFLIIFFIQLGFFALASSFKTDKFTDLSYGLTFVIISFYLFFQHAVFSLFRLILVLMVFLWGLRLAVYLFIRILKTKKDYRFDGIRENFLKFAQFWFFQALAIFIISLPFIVILNSVKKDSFNFLTFLGFALWFLGLSLETVADYQKFVFKNKPENKDKWIDTGLWSLARYPNYFGEMLCWWGIFIYCLPLFSFLEYLTIISPLFITFILIKVSGIPLLEKRYMRKYGQNPQYLAYKKNTNLLIPFKLKREVCR